MMVGKREGKKRNRREKGEKAICKVVGNVKMHKELNE